jgi:hypothetical protein
MTKNKSTYEVNAQIVFKRLEPVNDELFYIQPINMFIQALSIQSALKKAESACQEQQGISWTIISIIDQAEKIIASQKESTLSIMLSSIEASLNETNAIIATLSTANKDLIHSKNLLLSIKTRERNSITIKNKEDN